MLSRREMLRRAALFALGAAAVESCSSPKPTDTPAAARPPATLAAAAPSATNVPPTAVPTLSPTAAPSPTLTRVPPSPTPDQAYMAVVRGTDAEKMARAAVDVLGGIDRFIKRGDDVIVKPNICIASYGPE